MIQQIKALFNKLDIATETTIAMGNVTAEMFLLFDLSDYDYDCSHENYSCYDIFITFCTITVTDTMQLQVSKAATIWNWLNIRGAFDIISF